VLSSGWTNIYCANNVLIVFILLTNKQYFLANIQQHYHATAFMWWPALCGQDHSQEWSLINFNYNRYVSASAKSMSHNFLHRPRAHLIFGCCLMCEKIPRPWLCLRLVNCVNFSIDLHYFYLYLGESFALQISTIERTIRISFSINEMRSRVKLLGRDVKKVAFRMQSRQPAWHRTAASCIKKPNHRGLQFLRGKYAIAA